MSFLDVLFWIGVAFIAVYLVLTALAIFFVKMILSDEHLFESYDDKG